jgi:hypothetical protein
VTIFRRRVRNPEKIKRTKIARREWDFIGVKPQDHDAVCEREYARECLRAWEDGRLKYRVMIHEALLSQNGERDPQPILQAIRRGLEARAKSAPARKREAVPTVTEISLDYAAKSLIKPPFGCYDVCLRIDWTAGNEEIKTALGKWVETHSRGAANRPQATAAYESAILHLLSAPVEEQRQWSYADLAKLLHTRLMVMPKEKVNGGYPAAYVIRELRQTQGAHKGRRDSSEILLEDLGIYRLHRAGRTPEQIGAALGKKAGKYENSSRVRRLVKAVENRLDNLFTAAYFFELAAAPHRTAAEQSSEV